MERTIVLTAEQVLSKYYLSHVFCWGAFFNQMVMALFLYSIAQIY